MLGIFFLCFLRLVHAACTMCDVTVHVRNSESHIQTAGQCAPWKVASSVEHPVVQGLKFQKQDAFREFPGGSGIRLCRT